MPSGITAALSQSIVRLTVRRQDPAQKRTGQKAVQAGGSSVQAIPQQAVFALAGLILFRGFLHTPISFP
jgi:hypothetical protein